MSKEDYNREMEIFFAAWKVLGEEGIPSVERTVMACRLSSSVPKRSDNLHGNSLDDLDDQTDIATTMTGGFSGIVYIKK